MATQQMHQEDNGSSNEVNIEMFQDQEIKVYHLKRRQSVSKKGQEDM